MAQRRQTRSDRLQQPLAPFGPLSAKFTYTTHPNRDSEFRILLSDVMAAAMLGKSGADMRTYFEELNQQWAGDIRDIATKDLQQISNWPRGEALDMIASMSTGNGGSLSTGHANTPEDLVRRYDAVRHALARLGKAVVFTQFRIGQHIDSS